MVSWTARPVSSSACRNRAMQRERFPTVEPRITMRLPGDMPAAQIGEHEYCLRASATSTKQRDVRPGIERCRLQWYRPTVVLKPVGPVLVQLVLPLLAGAGSNNMECRAREIRCYEPCGSLFDILLRSADHNPVRGHGTGPRRRRANETRPFVSTRISA